MSNGLCVFVSFVGFFFVSGVFASDQTEVVQPNSDDCFFLAAVFLVGKLVLADVTLLHNEIALKIVLFHAHDT